MWVKCKTNLILWIEQNWIKEKKRVKCKTNLILWIVRRNTVAPIFTATHFGRFSAALMISSWWSFDDGDYLYHKSIILLPWRTICKNEETSENIMNVLCDWFNKETVAMPSPFSGNIMAIQRWYEWCYLATIWQYGNIMAIWQYCERSVEERDCGNAPLPSPLAPFRQIELKGRGKGSLLLILDEVPSSFSLSREYFKEKMLPSSSWLSTWYQHFYQEEIAMSSS